MESFLNWSGRRLVFLARAAAIKLLGSTLVSLPSLAIARIAVREFLGPDSMNKHDFISSLQKQEQKFKRSVFCLVMACGVCLLLRAFADYAHEHALPVLMGVDLHKYIRWACFALLVSFTIPVIASCGSLIKCPHCKKLLDGIHGHIAVATGCCGYCGERVFEQEFDPRSNS